MGKDLNYAMLLDCYPSLPLAKKYFKSRAKNLRDLLDFFCGI